MSEGGRAKPAWLQRLANRWNVSPARAGIILVVFACTGFTVLFLKRPLVAWASGAESEPPLLFSILYYILILPVYNLLLLAYGALFGQFSFFWAFEKRLFA
ncbi:MAG: DUF6787 family protein, partial [Flavobacteriales bacterium]